MSDYFDLDGLKLRSLMPDEDIDELETRYPGFCVAQIQIEQSKINSRLRKRYAVPFAAPCPEIVLGWLAAKVTPTLYLKRGINPNDPTFAVAKEAKTTADTELKEAADAEGGLFELPLREDIQTSAVTRGPLGCSQASPYEWIDDQAQAIDR